MSGAQSSAVDLPLQFLGNRHQGKFAFLERLTHDVEPHELSLHSHRLRRTRLSRAEPCSGRPIWGCRSILCHGRYFRSRPADLAQGRRRGRPNLVRVVLQRGGSAWTPAAATDRAQGQGRLTANSSGLAACSSANAGIACRAAGPKLPRAQATSWRTASSSSPSLAIRAATTGAAASPIWPSARAASWRVSVLHGPGL